MRPSPAWLGILLLLQGSPRSAEAQAASGCSTPSPLPDGNTLVSCRHVNIEIERGADLSVESHGPSGGSVGAILRSGAVYIEDQSKAGRSWFQIRTPDAIASVRGTSWAVDVTGSQSSVFVVTGIVAVRRRLDGARVTLTAGDGVDVKPESIPPVVKRWPAARAGALLGRFGR